MFPYIPDAVMTRAVLRGGLRDLSEQVKARLGLS